MKVRKWLKKAFANKEVQDKFCEAMAYKNVPHLCCERMRELANILYIKYGIDMMEYT